MKKVRSVLQILIFTALIAGAVLMVGPQTWSQELAQIFSSKKSAEEKCDLAPRPREFKSEPYYTGQLIDAHLHVPVSSGIVSAVGKKIGFEQMTSFSGKFTANYLNCLLKSEGISTAIGFFLTTKFSLGQEVRTAQKFTKDYKGIITPFFMPGPYDALRVSVAATKEALTKNKSLFRGIGEVKMFDGSTPDDPKFSALFDLAAENNLVVMFHPYEQHRAALEKILKKYPNARFLLHGGNVDAWIMDIIRDYKNVYYSLDADLMHLYGWKPEHEKKQPSKDEWLVYIRKNFASVINQSLERWGNRIESYPDRFLWGTDRWYGWHFEEEVSGVITEFSRSFIGKLDPSVREKFAYKNAQVLLKME